MKKFKDFTLELGNYNKMEEHTGSNVFVLAVRNILLSKPGNYPFTPGLGMDIEKYLFDLADDMTAQIIKSELNRQINRYVEGAENVDIKVEILEDPNDPTGLRHILGIAVYAVVNGEEVTTNFLLYKDSAVLNIYNETY